MTDADNVAGRLKDFIERLGLSNSQFADACGIPRPSLSQILTGRNKKISDVIVGMIHRAYPQLNVVWLLFGEGNMVNLPPSDDENARENPDFRNVNGNDDQYRKENGLEMPQNTSGNRVNSMFPPNFNPAVSADKKNKISENPRKVVQITVYYDDNSYETFYPKK